MQEGDSHSDLVMANVGEDALVAMPKIIKRLWGVHPFSPEGVCEGDTVGSVWLTFSTPATWSMVWVLVAPRPLLRLPP